MVLDGKIRTVPACAFNSAVPCVTALEAHPTTTQETQAAIDLCLALGSDVARCGGEILLADANGGQK